MGLNGLDQHRQLPGESFTEGTAAGKAGRDLNYPGPTSIGGIPTSIIAYQPGSQHNMNNPITSDTITSVFQSIVDHAHRYPNKAAILCDNRTLTYGMFRDALFEVHKALTARNLGTSSLIVVDSRATIEYLISSAAIMSLGLVPVPVSSRTPEVWAEIIRDVKPVLVIIADTVEPESLESQNMTVVTLDTLRKEGRKLKGMGIKPKQFDPEDTAMILYSSGTTSGVRKGVMQPIRALEATARYITDIMKITEEIVEYVASPLDTAFGYGRCRVIFRNGGTLLFNDGMFNAVKMLVMLQKNGGNAIAGDSTIFVILMKNFYKYLAELGPQIRWIKAASQPLSLENRQQLRALMPNANLFINYGLTEAMRCCIFQIGTRDDKEETVGRACPGNHIHIVSDDGKTLSAGEVGEIRVTGNNLAKGYWGKKLHWQKVFQDGWFTTGDLGMLDAEGYLYILGRKDDMVNVGGRKVSPDEVEHLLRPFLKNFHYCVLGIPDPSSLLGEVLAICIEGSDTSIDLKTLIQRCGGQVASRNLPTMLYSLDKLPMTENGKFQRRIIREQILSINQEEGADE